MALFCGYRPVQASHLPAGEAIEKRKDGKIMIRAFASFPIDKHLHRFLCCMKPFCNELAKCRPIVDVLLTLALRQPAGRYLKRPVQTKIPAGFLNDLKKLQNRKAAPIFATNWFLNQKNRKMRKLKLQMHLSLDNYVNMEQGGTNFKWDDEVIRFCIHNLEIADTILLGRNTAQEFIPFWDEVAANRSHPDFTLGKRISEIQKIVFSNTITHHQWKNTTIIHGSIHNEIIKLKKSEGKDILVYGGASFASSLIQNHLVDEFYFLLNPFCLGKGLTVFKPNKDILAFTLVRSIPFPCGTVMLCYKPNY